MNNPLLHKIASFPTEPGVYLMKDDKGKVIYVGKAKSLRQRVKNYFTREADSRYQVRFLLKRVIDIDYLVCANEKEALLLENSLIKKHKPRYNINLRDDKSYVSLRLGIDHPFPRLVVTRRIKKDGALYFGPYASAEACRETVEFIYQHFQLRTCSDNEFSNRSRPCLEYQIKRCTAPCVGLVSREQYGSQVTPVRFFLEGRSEELIKMLENKMNQAAKQEKFEEAARLRDLMANIETTLEKQRVVHHGGLHQDLVYLYREEQKGIVAVMNIRDGTLVDSRYYPVNSVEWDSVLLEQFLNQYYADNPFLPDEVLVSCDVTQIEGLQNLLSEKKGRKINFRNPKRGEKKELLALAEQNAREQFTRSLKREVEIGDILNRLKIKLHLPKIPFRIECYDISNISGEMATASCVVFVEGKAEKSRYRHYKIEMNEGPNDYAMMNEVLSRRFAAAGKSDPDLIIVDGGKGQLAVAIKALETLEKISVPVVAIAKGKGRGARAKGLWKEKKEEEIYLPHRKNSVILRRGSPELMLLQRIRDEAHRFALKYHRKLRDEMRIIKTLALSL